MTVHSNLRVIGCWTVPVALMVAVTGCGKVPTWGELTGQQQQQPVQVAPAQQQQPTAAPSQPAAPPKPPSPEEVIASFKALQPGQISDDQLANLASLPAGLDTVTEIDASGSSVTNGGLAALEKLPTLKQLQLAGTKVGDEGAQHLARIPSLESLVLNSTQISDSGVAALTALPNLKRLELMGCTISTAGFAAIGKMPALETLIFNNTVGMNDANLDLVCEARTIKSLQLGHCGVTDRGLVSLRKLESLEELIIAGGSATGDGLMEANKSKALKGLKRLNMWGAPISLNGAKAINSFKSLEYLMVAGIAMDDQGFVILTQGLKNLKELHVKNCTNVKGAGLTAIKAADDLEILVLEGTGLVDQALPLLKGHKRLKLLDLNNTHCTLAGVQNLKKALPDCEILFAAQKY